MPTLILSQRYSTDSSALWRAALDAEWDVERLRGFAIDPSVAERDQVLYGETIFGDAVASVLALTLLQPWDDWLPRLPERYRLRSVRLVSLAEARALRGPTFIKAPDEKWFPAAVYPSGAALDLSPQIADDLQVLIADPVVFELEFRMFVKDRSIAASSVYIRGGEAAVEAGEWRSTEDESAQAQRFAEAVISDPEVPLPGAVVVDVGYIRDRGWAVVEANAAWASGLCGVDPRLILPVLQRATVRSSAISPEDAAWARGSSGAQSIDGRGSPQD